MKKNIFLLLLTIGTAMALFGCGRNNQDHAEQKGTDAVGTENHAVSDVTGTESAADTENTSQLKLGTAVEIPESFEGELAETDAHESLERAIAKYCNVAEEDYFNVRYYYNYVDLNGDSNDEILALVLGHNIKGIDGNVLLWLDESDEDKISDASVKQAFRQIGVPVYVSNHMTQGYRDLIIADIRNTTDDAVTEAGTDNVVSDGATGEGDGLMNSVDQTYKLLTWNGDQYQTLQEGKVLYHLEGYEGSAILTNNIESDWINDNYHVLGEAMR